MITLKMAIAAERAVSIYWKGARHEVEPYGILHAKTTQALVLVAWVPLQNQWEFFRFAEIRGLEFLARTFTRRPEPPRMVPRGRTTATALATTKQLMIPESI